MRVPYVVGRWVRGNNHYGRQPLIDYLLSIEDNAVWVMGTRRLGKTSLLRQIEFLTQDDASYVPLFWDLQGCETVSHLSEELYYAIEDAFERFDLYDIAMADFADLDAIGILRALNRKLAQHERRLLLLIDETEALLNVNERDGAWLARLRKAIQRSEQRTIATSTILLSKLNDANSSWTTSPFLFGFRLVNLCRLGVDSAIDLVRQMQTDIPVEVDSMTVHDILNFTNGHPYLIQYLCQLLFVSDELSGGWLRPVEEDDLNPDQLLAGFFHIDFQHLSQLERDLLLLIAQESIASEETLYEFLPDQPVARMQSFLGAMETMGQVRRVGNFWTVGNEFLRRWLIDHLNELPDEAPSMVSDARVEALVTEGVHQQPDLDQGSFRPMQQTSRNQRSLDQGARSAYEPNALTRRTMSHQAGNGSRSFFTRERRPLGLAKRLIGFGGGM